MPSKHDIAYNKAGSILSELDARTAQVFDNLDIGDLMRVATDLKTDPLVTIAKMTATDVGRVNAAGLMLSVFLRAAMRKAQALALEGEDVGDFIPDEL